MPDAPKPPQPPGRLSVIDWVLILYGGAWLILQLLNAVGASPLWLEAVGLMALWLLARPDTNLGRAALAHVAVLAVVAVGEGAWSAWTGNWSTAATDVAYLALAWTLRYDLAAAARRLIEQFAPATQETPDDRT